MGNFYQKQDNNPKLICCGLSKKSEQKSLSVKVTNRINYTTHTLIY